MYCHVRAADRGGKGAGADLDDWLAPADLADLRLPAAAPEEVVLVQRARAAQAPAKAKQLSLQPLL